MATIAEIKRRFDRIYGEYGSGMRKIVSDEANRTSDVILDLNRDQILYGRDAYGNPLVPMYYNDPYFKTWEQALAYSNYKLSISERQKGLIHYSNIQLFPTKDRNTPNLIHSTGTFFFNHFFIKVSSDSYTVGSTGIAAPDIESKYGKIYGLAPASRNFYYQNWIRVAIMQGLKSAQIGIIK